MAQKRYFLPAEWEHQSGVMLTWPHEQTDWRPYLKEITKTFTDLADAITRKEKLIIATPHPDRVTDLINKRLSREQMDNVSIYTCPSNDTWARDHGPISLVESSTDKGSVKRCQLLDFKFNGWGDKFPSKLDNAITQSLYSQGALNGELVDNDDFVLEGGSIESDGKGTIMTTSFCLLAPNRNQPLSKAEIESQLLKRLCAKRIVWIDHGKLIGDDTDGHIDTIVRFAPNDTLLYIGCDDESDPQYEDFKLMEKQLKCLHNNNGKLYRLLRLPMPDPIYDGDDRLPATYANFLVINGAVIVPTYNQADNDRIAMETIGEAFPSMEIIPIDATTIIRQHGSIHCLTMQFPDNII